jgi:hypothetical protein
MRTSQQTAGRDGGQIRCTREVRRPAPPLGSAGLWTGTRNLPSPKAGRKLP